MVSPWPIDTIAIVVDAIYHKAFWDWLRSSFRSSGNTACLESRSEIRIERFRQNLHKISPFFSIFVLLSKRRPVWDNYKEKVAKKRMRKGEESSRNLPKKLFPKSTLEANNICQCQTITICCAFSVTKSDAEIGQSHRPRYWCGNSSAWRVLHLKNGVVRTFWGVPLFGKKTICQWGILAKSIAGVPKGKYVLTSLPIECIFIMISSAVM